MEIINKKIEDIKPYSNNAKKHDKAQIEKVAKSIKEFGFNQPIVVDKDNVIIVGHGRYFSAKSLGLTEIPVVEVNLSDEQAKAYRLADNKLNESDWNMNLVVDELKDLSDEMVELTGFELTDIKDNEWREVEKSVLSDNFIIPPFSVWDTKQGYWLDRKRKWKEFFGDSRLGRDSNLLGEGLKDLGKKFGSNLTGTSEFDPVVAEICYRWFNIQNGEILDPFAGGTVRGAVASVLGQKYTGIDLSSKQLDINNKKIKELNLKNTKYILGNSLNINSLIKNDRKFDFIFSCPPYYDLEKYNDGEGDLSMKATYSEFLKDYKSIIKKSVDKLKNNRFAVFTVGNIRDKKGFYRNFVNDTIQAFEYAGAKFYNDIVLLNSISTASIRSGRPFRTNRKITKVHQNVLVFYKGDLNEIKKSLDELPKVKKHHGNVLVFYKGDIGEIKNNFKKIVVDLNI